MKKQIIILAILPAVTALTGCSNELQFENQPVGIEPANAIGETYQLVIGAKKANDGFTRALSDNGTKILATWASTDKVYAYVNDASADADAIELAPNSAGDNSTVLTGAITKEGGFTTSDVIHLYYLKKKSAYDSRSYDNQDGTLSKIASDFDYATADVSIIAVGPASLGNDNILRTSDATFVHQQAITKFTVEKKNGVTMGDDKMTALNISATAGLVGGVTVTPASPGLTEFYVAMSNPASATYTFDATLGGKSYTTSKSVTLVDDKYYTATLTMGKDSKAFDLQLPATPAFNGSEIVIDPKDEDGTSLTEGTDYTVTYYKKNTSTDEWEEVTANPYIQGAGDYKVVVEGKGDYSGTAETELTVAKGTPVITIPDGKDESVLPPGGTLSIAPTVSTGLVASNLTYDVSSTPATGVVTVDENGIVTAVGGGVATITVSYPATGDDNRNAATPQTITVYVKQSGIGGDLDQPGEGSDW